MILTPATVLALAALCAPAVAPETLLAVAQVESGLNPFAIGVNGGPSIPPPQSQANAVLATRRLMAQGGRLDLGLAQINTANLVRLGLSLQDAFDPCRNLAAAARLLRADFERAQPTLGDEQLALRTALSLYNTGDGSRGFRNGYVARVEASAARRAAETPTANTAAHQPPPVERPAWDVFGTAHGATFVITPTSQGATR